MIATGGSVADSDADDKKPFWKWIGRLGKLAGALGIVSAVFAFWDTICQRAPSVAGLVPYASCKVIGTATVPQPPVVAPASDKPVIHPPRPTAEQELEIERVRRETLEKALKDVAAARAAEEEARKQAQSKEAPGPQALVVPPAPPQVQPPPKAPTQFPPRPRRVEEVLVPPQQDPKPAERCETVGPRLTVPLPVRAGLRICAAATPDHAEIRRVLSDAVVFSVNGGYEITCVTNELCQFNWPEGPMFRVRIQSDATGTSRASLITPGR